MKMLFVLPAETIYDQANRVMGWRQTPSPRKKLKLLKDLVPRLKELGIGRVIASDLDGQSGWLIARNLGLPCEEWQSLRRLNFGKLHGLDRSKAEAFLADMQKKWKHDPSIPLPSGDSQKSYEKRMSASRQRLQMNSGKTTCVIAAGREIAAITGTQTQFERGRIYQWETDHRAASPIQSSAA